MSHWQLTADLAAVRDKDALAKLPTAERAAFTKFWTDVAAVLTKLEQKGYGAFTQAAPKEANRPKSKNE